MRDPATAIGIGHGHAVYQAGCQHEALPMAGASRDQHQPLAVVQQLLVAGDAPECETFGIYGRIGIRVELHHGIVAGQPGRLRVARIQCRIFQQAQAPAPRRLLRRPRPAAMAQPVEPVVGMPAQILPGERERIQPKDIQVRSGRIPMRDVVRIDHDASSCEQESPPRQNYALHRRRRNIMG